MGAKAGLEYDVVNVCLDGEKWGANKAVAQAVGAMAAEGWALASCSHPQPRWAVLVFSRPRRAEAHENDRGPDRGPIMPAGPPA